MTSFIGNIVKSNTNITDDVLLTNMLATSKAIATVYFSAAMLSTTPELRSMFSTALTQIMGGHASLAEFAVKYGWEKPYDLPTQQLSDAYKHSITEMQ